MSMADGYTAVQALSLIWIKCLQNEHEGRLINTHPHPQAPVIWLTEMWAMDQNKVLLIQA